MRWCFGHGAANLGTTAQTQVASGYVRVLWQCPSALVLAVRDMLGKASRTLGGAVRVLGNAGCVLEVQE